MLTTYLLVAVFVGLILGMVIASIFDITDTLAFSIIEAIIGAGLFAIALCLDAAKLFDDAEKYAKIIYTKLCKLLGLE